MQIYQIINYGRWRRKYRQKYLKNIALAIKSGYEAQKKDVFDITIFLLYMKIAIFIFKRNNEIQ